MRSSFLALALLGLGLGLSGCVATVEVPPNSDANDDAICRSYGETPKTKEYKQCRYDLRHARMGGAPYYYEPAYFYPGPAYCRETYWGVRCY
ncbi:hypothetical protein [Methylovirgula sp. 4M-Z18]|uniref:hypothetical protein n=1 Tax=Methylovirgula sp. 4M-Z18 TaxID=2293567 RepID=UPI000E2E785C|nr:hypothetical protein [Methylovirgula sp. 4M-Z18]RFB78238.1 hypothetical protein DYH55_17890 [Methylovirgula sp. 4M-Z18]